MKRDEMVYLFEYNSIQLFVMPSVRIPCGLLFKYKSIRKVRTKIRGEVEWDRDEVVMNVVLSWVNVAGVRALNICCSC